MRLYDNAGSTNALKVRFLAAELGLELERAEIPLDGERPLGYRELHPFGLIPALEDGELVLTESNTILRYLAEVAGRADLRGATPAERARIDGVMDSLSLEVRPALWAVEEVVVYGLDAPLAGREQALAETLTAFDALLDAAGPYALGDFTIADCALAGRGLHVPDLPIAPSVAPRTRRTIAAAQARPAFALAR